MFAVLLPGLKILWPEVALEQIVSLFTTPCYLLPVHCISDCPEYAATWTEISKENQKDIVQTLHLLGY